MEVQRYSLRRGSGPLASAVDVEEARRTRVVLEAGRAALVLASLATLLARPVRFLRALALAVGMARHAHRRRLRWLAYLAEACLLRRWLAAARIDHLHAHFATNPAAVALLCRTLGGPPYSFTAHGPDDFADPEPRVFSEKVRAAAFVVAISEFGRAEVRRLARPDDAERIHVVRCGVGKDFLECPGAPPPSAPRLFCVARLGPAKRLDLLVEAVALLVADGEPLELHLAGDGPLRAELEAQIARAGLAGRVHLLGWISTEAVRRGILESRALVLSSLAEGLPVVIMESFALGRPVVATRVAGVPELVVDGESGWLVPAGAVPALASALRAALRASPEELERMGRAGSLAVRQRHDAGREAARLLGLFELALGRAQRAD